MMFFGAALASGAFAGMKAASTSPSSIKPADLAELSLEELLNVKVITVSKREESVITAPAAIHVITQEDIRRSGATSIPEALRLAPGMQVARLDAHQWAISARGFNDPFANKLLVMIDGRSIYTPLFSGVFWDVQDTLMEDIDRIEVIRGPGATLWGANAVNGVVNIITKKAKDTQGLLVTGGGGTEETGFGSLRYGGRINEEAHYRIYAKYFDRDDSALPGGRDAFDGYEMGRAGFRVDWEPGDINLLTFQGDIYYGEVRQQFGRLSPMPPFMSFTENDNYDVAGGNLLGRWTHSFSDEAELTLQTYYDRTFRNTVIFKETRDTVDVDLQHRFPLGDRQKIIWGLGYRVSSDDIRDSFDLSFDPDQRTIHLFSGFVQDEIRIVEDRLWLTIGTKLEHNDFTGVELQPGARLLWTPHERHAVWGSVARAVRTPSRAEHDVRLNRAPVFPPGALFPGSPPAVTSFFGNESFDSEKLIAYEIGYRVRPHDRVMFDLALFFNDYDDLRSLEPGSPPFRVTPMPPHVPFFAGNGLHGETYGGELSVTLQVAEGWLWKMGYSYLEMQIQTRSGSGDTTSVASLEGNNPHHQFFIRSLLDLPHNVELNLGVRYVDRLAAMSVPSYVVMDAQVTWRPVRNLEISVAGQNLLESRHAEFRPTLISTQATEVEHSVYGKLTWRF